MSSSVRITKQDGSVEVRNSISSNEHKFTEKLKKRGIGGFWCCCGTAAGILILLVLGLALGLTFGLKHKHNSNDDGDDNNGGTNTSTTTTSTASGVTPTATSWWQPIAGTTWQIVLYQPPSNLSINVDVYDIDLFDNNATFVKKLQNRSYRVICYFSAGSYETWRSDAHEFQKSDYGEPLDGWAREYWLNTSSPNVRRIMAKRLDTAAANGILQSYLTGIKAQLLTHNIGCDGVDPDNIMVYNVDTGFNLTTADAIDYVKFLADASHARGMAMGLKNGGDIVKQVIDKMDWEVNESCAAYDECDLFAPFIKQNKPVFHIEYPDESHLSVQTMCNPKTTTGFSTVIKKLDLTDWVEYCPAS